MPVVAGHTYYVDVPVLGATGTPSVQPKITWLDNAGATLSTTNLTNTATTSSWQTISGTATAPADARFAVLTLALSGSVGNVVRVDMIQIAKADGPYRDPRSVTIICQPNRVNLLHDPSFEVATASWTALAGTFTNSTDNPMIGLRSGKCVQAAGPAVFNVATNTFPVAEGYPYSVSAYLTSATSASCNVLIDWYATGSSLISTSSTTVSLTPDWQRVDYTDLAPDGAVEARLRFSGLGTTYIDACTFERADRPPVFFSGSVADNLSQDSMWSDGTPQSYSLLYSSRLTKTARLTSTIGYYLPVGVTARILLWDSQDPEVLALVPLGA